MYTNTNNFYSVLFYLFIIFDTYLTYAFYMHAPITLSNIKYLEEIDISVHSSTFSSLTNEDDVNHTQHIENISPCPAMPPGIWLA